MRRLIVNQEEEERTSVNEQGKERLKCRQNEVQPDLRMQRSYDYNRHAFQYNPADDYNLCLQIANKILHQLRMSSPNQSVAASFDVELRREQSYNTTDLLSYVSRKPKLIPN
ncbi:unnamed protein product [Onchocerca flexuosa]|uniref:Uncharacterized protein n=1 Tax=Onchocerca flexuosa TaxID=387005 RepID=A0A183HC15_9BILA|nr:unnamed protein product [Onchocerca flexuosa]